MKIIKFNILDILIPATILLIVLGLYLLIPPKLILTDENDIIIEYPNEYKNDGYKAVFFGTDVTKDVIVKTNFDAKKVGEYKINYIVKNKLGIFSNKVQRKIKVVDTVPPQIELIGNDILLLVGDDYKEPGYTATDNYDGNITDKVVVEGNIDINKTGEYKLKYTVEDSSNNSFEIERTITVAQNNVSSVPILTYHGFMSREEKDQYVKGEKYTISAETFEEQLKYLKDNGYRTITLDDFYKWYTHQIFLTEKDVVIVIDDGNISQYQYAIPLIEKYGFNATIFVITGRIKDTDVKYDPAKTQFFSQAIIDDIKNNHKSIRLESHTNNLHQLIDGQAAIKVKTDEEIEEDLKISKEKLDANYMAFPYGWNTPSSAKILSKLEFKMAFAFGYGNYGRATMSDDQYYIKRVNINAETTMNEFIYWLEER